MTASSTSKGASPEELFGQQILSHCTGRISMLEALLEALVEVPSPTGNAIGLGRCLEILEGGFSSMGFTTALIQGVGKTQHLLARRPGAEGAPTVLLMGHVDTVFAEDHPFRGLKRDKVADKATGPGVGAKGGVVSILALLDALQPLNLLDAFDFRVLVTTDGEEQAEASEAMTQKIAKGAELALIFEPATRDGALVTGRSGAGRFELQVTGRSAHAGDNVTAGRNAILELAHKIPQIDALTNPRSGVVANCAVIEGGTRAHVVPDRAGLVIDVRCRQASDANAIRERLTAIAADSMLEGCSTELSGRIGRPPWQAGDASRVLFDIWRSAAHTLRVPELKDTTAGSPSGANLLAPTGIAILDGLGPIAGDTHQTGEWLKLSSLPERTALNALALVTWLHQRAQGIWRARS